MANDFYVGLDEIVGAALSELAGDDDELSVLLSGDEDELVGEDLDEIVGAEVAKRVRKAKKASTVSALAKLRAAGQRGIVQRGQSDMKWELLPIPRATLAAGTTVQVAITPIRSQRLDKLRFPSSNPDHQFITLLGIEIMGVQQLNGNGGVCLSELSEMATDSILRGSTVQRADNLFITLRNDDVVNARTYYGSIGGPTIRISG